MTAHLIFVKGIIQVSKIPVGRIVLILTVAFIFPQQLRKLVLEMIHRLPSNEFLKPYLRQILAICFRLLQKDNEENVMVALRIIIELHKTYRPQFTPEVRLVLGINSFIYLIFNVTGSTPRNVQS